MFSKDAFRLYLFGFLAFCVLSSKHILIYNEETLVALSFFAFVFFVARFFGTTISDSFQERSQTIHQELQNFFLLKEETLKELAHEHTKIARLGRGIQSLAGFTTAEIHGFQAVPQKILSNIFIDQILMKFKTLAASKLLLQQQLQSLFAQDILANVLVRFHQGKAGKTKTPSVAPETLQRVLDFVRTAKKR